VAKKPLNTISSKGFEFVPDIQWQIIGYNMS